MTNAPLGYRIGAVAKLTGLTTHAIRVWERRYGLIQPQRGEKGDRRYTDADIEKLRLLGRLTSLGHGISTLAGRSTAELRAMIERHGEAAPPPPVGFDVQTAAEEYLTAVRQMKLEQADEVLNRAAGVLEPRQLVLGMLAPLLHEVGDRWEGGDLCVAHEHAASAMIRNHLGRLLGAYRARPGAKGLVACTLEGELHEFGALFTALLGAMHGWRSAYLGPDLPHSEIVQATREHDASAVLVSAVALQPELARARILELRAALPMDVQLVVGGDALNNEEELGHGVLRLDLMSLERWLTQ